MSKKVSSFRTQRKHSNGIEFAAFKVTGKDDILHESQELVFTNVRQQIMPECLFENEKGEDEIRPFSLEQLFPDGREPGFNITIKSEAPCMEAFFDYGFAINLKTFTGYIFISKCYSDEIMDIFKKVVFYQNKKAELIIKLPKEEAGYFLFFYTNEENAFTYFQNIDFNFYEESIKIENWKD